MYKKFQQLISERQLTCYKVAKDTGLYRSLFSDWKKGRCKPKADKLMVLANYFNVPLEYFYEE